MPGTPGTQRPRSLPLDYLYGAVGGLPVGETTIYAVPAGRVASVASLVLYNPTAGPITPTVHVRAAPGGVVDAAGVLNEILSEAIATKARLIITATQLLNLPEGSTISAASSGAGLNAWVAGTLGDM